MHLGLIHIIKGLQPAPFLHLLLSWPLILVDVVYGWSLISLDRGPMPGEIHMNMCNCNEGRTVLRETFGIHL